MQERHEILILGPEAAGKTQLVNRLLKKEFNSQYESTVGIEIHKKNISDTRTISYRDVASDSDTFSFERYFFSSHQIYLVFNAHDDNGLEDLKKYIEQFEFPDTAKITLIGTHADEGINTNTENAAKVYASELDGEYCPISSLEENNFNIQSLLFKSSILQTPILQSLTNRRSPVDGSSFHDGATSVIGLSSVALNQHSLRTQGQNIRGHHGNERKSAKTLSAHNLSGSQAQMSDYNPEYKTSVPQETNTRGYRRWNRQLRQEQTQSPTLRPLPAPASANTTPAPENTYSFAFRMAGIAMILAAVIGLIYTALVVVNILTATTLISLMNHIVVGIGSLLGASTSTNIVTLAASLNVSKTAVAAMLMTGPSVALLALGFGVFRAGQKPVANNQDTHHRNFSNF